MYSFFLIIFEQVIMYLPLLLGAYISFSLMKTPDLSIESAFLFGAVAGAKTIQLMDGLSPKIILPIVITAALLGGALVGAISSCITRFGKIPALLSSIITIGIFQGFFLLMFSTPYISLARYTNPLMITMLTAHHNELISISLITTIVTIVTTILLSTQLGHCFAIFGINNSFFNHFNISAQYVFIVGIILANGLAGLSGYFFAQTNNLIEINMGAGKSLFCITSLIMGKTIARNASMKTLLIPLAGLLNYFALQQTLLKLGFNLRYFTAIQALVVLILIVVFFQKNNSKIDQLGV